MTTDLENGRGMQQSALRIKNDAKIIHTLHLKTKYEAIILSSSCLDKSIPSQNCIIETLYDISVTYRLW